MKRLHHGKLYDTNTSYMVASTILYSHDRQTDTEVTLYLSAKGAFYFVTIDESHDLADMPRVTAITMSRALEWMEDHGVDPTGLADKIDIEEA